MIMLQSKAAPQPNTSQSAPVAQVGAQQEAEAAGLGGGSGQRPARHSLVVAHNLRGEERARVGWQNAAGAQQGGGRMQGRPCQRQALLMPQSESSW